MGLGEPHDEDEDHEGKFRQEQRLHDTDRPEVERDCLEDEAAGHGEQSANPDGTSEETPEKAPPLDQPRLFNAESLED